ncbi:MAG: exopolysaccharide biosynthesis polyprenyl glycosylphosphotransferase [Proteobacteria bacterium]|nr:exopolysaccharide biosynthesis polyprenyl glycosylphosphotransferase [Pseudomonadota bacterium]
MTVPSSVIATSAAALELDGGSSKATLRPPLAEKAVVLASYLSGTLGAVLATMLVRIFAPEAALSRMWLVLALAAITSAAVGGILRDRLPRGILANFRIEIARIGAIGLILGAILLLIHADLARTLLFISVWGVSALGISLLSAITLERMTTGHSLKLRVVLVGPAALVAEEAAVRESDDVSIAGLIELDGAEAMRELQLDKLAKFVRAGRCDSVLVMLPDATQNMLDMVIEKLKTMPIEVRACMRLAPSSLQRAGRSSSVRNIEFVAQEPPLRPGDELAKGVMDCVLGCFALVLFAPFMLLIALAVKLDTPGPVFFVQARGGRSGRPINVYKFRTMTTLENGQNITQATKGDLRVTRVGRFLRSTSLDELPQLINVVRGEMSLVGPRPHALAHDSLYRSMFRSYDSRFRVKPGITGWAQVNGLRGSTENPSLMRRRVMFDNCYINKWSPWLDLKIIFLTVFVFFRDDNAY